MEVSFRCSGTALFCILMISSILPGMLYLCIDNTSYSVMYMPLNIGKVRYRHEYPTFNRTIIKSFLKHKSNNISVHFISYHQVSRRRNVFDGCKFALCTFTSAPNDVYNRDKDILVFYAPSIAKNKKPPPKRKGQIWVLYTQESPVHHENNLKYWKNMFNWTVTYRYDSDCKFSYGEFRPRKAGDPPEYDVTSDFYNKTVDAAWWVSNCVTSSKRLKFTQRMRKHLNVHIYGACHGTHHCKRYSNKCFELLNTTYKYYLAFENSLCHDYVTEKVFDMFSNEIKVITVVRGAGSRVYKKLLPPKSYISTSDFQTVKDLANYMKLVGSNVKLYKSYFDWQKHYRVGGQGFEELDLCKVCEMAHQPQKHKRLYGKISEWFSGSQQYRPFCRAPDDLHTL